jgi:hypothetical protein
MHVDDVAGDLTETLNPTMMMELKLLSGSFMPRLRM